MRIGQWFGVAVVVLIGSSGLARGQMVVDGPRGYTFDVPSGFHEIAFTDKFAHTFATTDLSLGVPDAIVAILPLHTTVRPGAKPAMVPEDAAAGGTLSTRKWQLLDVWTLSVGRTVRGYPMVCREAQVPTTGESVDVVVMAKAGSHLSADPLLDAAPAGLRPIGPAPQVGGNGSALGLTKTQADVFVALVGVVLLALAVVRMPVK